MRPFRDYRPVIQTSPRRGPTGRHPHPAQLRREFAQVVGRSWGTAETATPGEAHRPAAETCDRCGPAVRAGYRAERAGKLYLCGHCANRLWRALSAQGWTFWCLGARAVAPQASTVPGHGPAEDTA